MYLTIVTAEGGMLEGVLLALDRTSMRVMFKESADTVEFRLQDGAWMDESGARVEFDFIANANEALVQTCARIFPLTRTARI